MLFFFDALTLYNIDAHKIRPVEGFSVCQMLRATGKSPKFEWSTDGVNWVIPKYYSAHYGGSAPNWCLFCYFVGMSNFLNSEQARG